MPTPKNIRHESIFPISKAQRSILLQPAESGLKATRVRASATRDDKAAHCFGDATLGKQEIDNLVFIN